MALYNVHTPQKTFALQYKDGEEYSALIDRIASKAGVQKSEFTSPKGGGKDKASLVYEYEGGRYSLEDDEDLSILRSRLPASSTPSATLHLTLPQHHAHFAPAPPAYSTASSTIKSKAQSKGSKESKDQSKGKSAPIVTTSVQGTSGSKANGLSIQSTSSSAVSAPSPKKHSKAGSEAGKLAPLTPEKSTEGKKAGKAMSFMSATSKASRHSKWGNDDAEPLGEVNKRKWIEFHNNNGVRTVMGKIGDVDGVRMLLKPGHKGVYVSRKFAMKHGLVSDKYAMGAAGYTGLKTLGNVSITVGGRTASHPALISEEEHFDVTLGRSWLERMAIKVDPLNQTALTYMDTGDAIPCDLVVLKDADGNVITVT